MIEEVRTDVGQLLRLNFDLLEATKGLSVREDYVCFSSLMKKFFYHGLAVYQLAHGALLGEGPTQIRLLDFASIQILARACLETFLTFDVLHEAAKSDDEFKFRYSAWHYCGFKKRQSFPADDPATQALKAAEAVELAKCGDRFRSTDYYKQLSEPHKKQVQDGWSWHPEHTLTSLAKPIFGEGWGHTVYPYLSDYTHSGALSVLQVEEITDPTDKEDAVELGMVTVSKLLALMNLRYAELFPQAERILRAHPLCLLNEGYAKLQPVNPSNQRQS